MVEVVSRRGWKVATPGAIEETYVVIEGSVFGVVARTKDSVFNLVAMVPLVPRQVMQCKEEAFGPFETGLAATVGGVVAVL